MSRSNYSDGLEDYELHLYRGRVASATRGKRGQKFFRDLVRALEAMPEKRLSADTTIVQERRVGTGPGLSYLIEEHKERIAVDGRVCALGQCGRYRGLDVSQLNAGDHDALGESFDIASCLAAEVMYMNDEFFCNYSDEERHAEMLKWAREQVRA